MINKLKYKREKNPIEDIKLILNIHYQKKKHKYKWNVDNESTMQIIIQYKRKERRKYQHVWEVKTVYIWTLGKNKKRLLILFPFSWFFYGYFINKSDAELCGGGGVMNDGGTGLQFLCSIARSEILSGKASILNILNILWRLTFAKYSSILAKVNFNLTFFIQLLWNTIF